MTLGTFRQTVRSVVKGRLRRMGYDIRPIECSENYQLQVLLDQFGIDLILDVGANIGQFARQLRSFGYKHEIVSFEALADAHGELLRAAETDPRWQVAPRAAMGAEEGTTEFHRAQNSVSSSALPMLDFLKSTEPGTECIRVERVPLKRLDQLAEPYLKAGSKCLLKIDTQGYEDRVLDGASGIMDQILGIHLELTLVPLYSGQLLFDAMKSKIEELGYRLWALWPEFVDPKGGRMLQVNGIFFRGQD